MSTMRPLDITMNNGILEFIKAAVKDPRAVSTVFPTMRFLAQALVDNSGLNSNQKVVELGCGTGAITKHILNSCNPESYTGFELSTDLVSYLNMKYPESKFYAQSASDLSGYIPDASVDVVIASLPWTIFPKSLQEEIAKEILRILKPGGKLTTFLCIHALAYPGAKRVQKLFRKHFSEFEYCESISRNIPPANVYLGIK